MQTRHMLPVIQGAVMVGNMVLQVAGTMLTWPYEIQYVQRTANHSQNFTDSVTGCAPNTSKHTCKQRNTV